MKVTTPVFKVPCGSTVPIVGTKFPTVPPGPVRVPLVSVTVEAEPSVPVTFKVPLVTLIVSPVVTPPVEFAERVSVPTPSKLKEPTLPALRLIGLAKVLPAVIEFRINCVLSETLIPARPAPILNAPPETIVPAKLTFANDPPVMVAPEVSEVVPKNLRFPVFEKTGTPARTVVSLKLSPNSIL